MTRYLIVPERSQVFIDARSSVHPIHSSTDGLEGFVDIDLDGDGQVDLSTMPVARLSLGAGRLSSGNRLEDRELYRRIDIRRYPTIEGVLDEINPAAQSGTYRVGGAVTFRGVTRHHEDDMTIDKLDDKTIRLAGSSRFDVRDYGLEPPRILTLKVEPEVDVRVEILAEKEG